MSLSTAKATFYYHKGKIEDAEDTKLDADKGKW